jgi:hypothetical protein
MSLLLDLYEVADPGRRRDLADLARSGQRDPWWADAADILPLNAGRYLGLEAEADTVRVFATQLIPGLLQEPAYTTAAIRATQPGLDAAQARTLTALARQRRESLDRHGFRLRAVLDEIVLRRAPASVSLMAAQLAYLADLALSGIVSIQVLPLTEPSAVLSSPFTILSFPDPDDSETACTQSHGGRYQLTTSRKHVRDLTGTFTKLSRAALSLDASAELLSTLSGRRPITDRRIIT